MLYATPGHNGIVRAECSHPPEHTRVSFIPWKNNPKCRSCMRHTGAWNPWVRVSAIPGRRPVKISTFRTAFNPTRLLRRPSPLVAMRSDFDEWIIRFDFRIQAVPKALFALLRISKGTTVKTWISALSCGRRCGEVLPEKKRSHRAFEAYPSDYTRRTSGGNSGKRTVNCLF